MMQGVLPDWNPEVILADTLYDECLPFGIDEVPDEKFTEHAKKVAETVISKYIRK